MNLNQLLKTIGKGRQIGVAVGALPVWMKDGVTTLTVNSKTMNAPDHVELGRGEKGVVRPSFLELKRQKDRSPLPVLEYVGQDVRTFTFCEGDEYEPNHPIVVCGYDPNKVTTLVINDDQVGPRAEQVVLFEGRGNSRKAGTVFSDSVATLVEINSKGKIFFDGHLVPEGYFARWADNDDSTPPLEDKNIFWVEKSVQGYAPTVPATALFLLIAKAMKQD